MTLCASHRYLEEKIDTQRETYVRELNLVHQDIEHIRGSMETVERHIHKTNEAMRNVVDREHEAVSFIVNFLQQAGTDKKNIPETPLAKRTARGEFEITKSGIRYKGPDVITVLLTSVVVLLTLILCADKLRGFF